MFSTLRTRFGIPGVISVIALVFAMFGGAYAASNSSNNGKATASAKVKKGPRGPKGATGPAGPAGAQGPAGPAGAKGDAGANGSNGAAGPTGPTGAAGAKGATGATGATGFSGFTETLPSGKTEMGSWSAVGIFGLGEAYPFAAISYPIPLSDPSGIVKFLDKEETEASVGSGGCELDVTNPAAKPVAPKDTLCVFTRAPEVNGTLTTISPRGQLPSQKGDSPAGTLLWFEPEAFPESGGNGVVKSFGTWAVTAK